MKIVFSIRWKLIISIILPLLVIAGIVMGFTLRRVYDSAATTLQQQHLREVVLLARSINSDMRSLARIAETTAAFLDINPALSEDDLYGLLRQNIGRNPLLYGAAIAFAPGAYKDKPLFSPYVYDRDLKQIDIGADAYDYTDGRWEWYTGVMETHAPLWTEPYFDNGAGDLEMTTYSHPVLRDGQFIGVTTIDLRLDQLSSTISSQLDGEMFMIMSPTGTFVSHYLPDQALHGSLQDFGTEQGTNLDYETVEDAILAGESGFASVNDMVINGEVVPGATWIFYSPIPSTGWFLATMHSEAVLTQPLREQMNIAVLGLSLTILLIFALVWVMSSRIARPIKKLETAVSDVARGKLDTTIENIRSLDELGLLSIGFNRMLKNLKKQIEFQSQQEAQQKLLEREWQMARDTQRSLLPTDFPPFPDRREFELHAVNQAAQHVAGDFFDFFFVNPHTLVFVIADVSGKGMSAALVMAVCRTILRDLALGGRTPGEILREGNERLRDNQKGGAFVTIFLGSFDVTTGRIVYANGGHVPPFLIGRDGSVENVGEATGTIVGMLEKQDYADAELTLQHGDTLLLYTDGFPEARSKTGEFFGPQRIRTFLERHTHSSPQELCEAALREINAFQSQHLADDITLLALRRALPQD